MRFLVVPTAANHGEDVGGRPTCGGDTERGRTSCERKHRVCSEQGFGPSTRAPQRNLFEQVVHPLLQESGASRSLPDRRLSA